MTGSSAARRLAAARRWALGLLGRARPCPICGGRSRLAGASWRHAYLRCTSCGLIYVSELPAAAAVHASYVAVHPTYQVEHKRNWPAWREHKQRTLEALELPHLERSLGGRAGRALEVGCGEGQLLAVLRQRGWDVSGIELNASLSEQARQLGFPVATAPLEDATPSGPFDLVLIVHLLEHLRQPLAALERSRGWLRTGGWLLVETPLRPDLDNIDHLYCFGAAALDLALRRCRFVPRRWFDYVDDHYRHHNLAVAAVAS